MVNVTRRELLRKSGVQATTASIVLGGAGTTVAASECDCDIRCNGVCGEVITVKEFSGNGTARYELSATGANIIGCFPDTYEENDYRREDGKGRFTVGGTVKDDSDKWVISGGGLNGIRVCDVDDPGASFAMELDRCFDHCAADYDDYAEVVLRNLSDGEPLCSEIGNGEASYQFCVSEKLENDDEHMEDDDQGEYWGYCARGHLQNGDADRYHTWGRIIELQTNPGGGNFYLRRNASDSC
jgi:hypothetical protein